MIFGNNLFKNVNNHRIFWSYLKTQSTTVFRSSIHWSNTGGFVTAFKIQYSFCFGTFGNLLCVLKIFICLSLLI